MENWYRLTNKTKKVGNIVLNEFVYNIDFMDKKKGESGGFVDDEKCLCNPFSSTNSIIYGDVKISEGTTIINSTVENSTIEPKFKIIDSELLGVIIKGNNLEKNKAGIQKEISKSKICGNSFKKITFVLEDYLTSSLVLSDARISLSEYGHCQGTENISVGKFCSLCIEKSNIVFKEREIKLDKRCKLTICNSKMVDPNILLFGKNILMDKRSEILDSYIVGSSGIITGHCIIIEDSEIKGTIVTDPTSKGIKIKKSLIGDLATIRVEKDSEKQLIENVQMTEISNILYIEKAKHSLIENSSISGGSFIRIKNRNVHINKSKIFGSATVVDCSLQDTYIFENAMVYNTSAFNCIFRGNVKIGFSLTEIIPFSLFSQTLFLNLDVKETFDFFAVSVIPGKHYIVFIKDKVYKLSDISYSKDIFEEINIEDEIKNLEKQIFEKDPEAIFNNKIINFLHVREDSKKNIAENILNKENPDYEKILSFSNKLIDTIVIKLLFVFLFLYECNIDEIKKYEEAIHQLEKKLVFDIKNKKYIKTNKQILLFPGILPRKIDNDYFDDCFLLEYLLKNGDEFNIEYDKAIIL